MQEGLYIASSAGVKQHRKLEVISNNLANLNTPGFKKDDLVFKEMVPPFAAQESMANNRNTLLPMGLSNHAVSYVEVNGQTTDFQQGTLLNTGNDLDLALDGDGFFAVTTPQGTRYTRVGNFKLNEQGQFVDKNGHLIQTTDDKPLLIPPTGGQITIDRQGTVSIGSGLEVQPVGQVKVVRFEDQSALLKEGDGMYVMEDPDQQPLPNEQASVMQGFVETSNVSAIEEMSKMIQTVRTFEAYQRIIQSIDEADQNSVNSIARLA
ncbi:flagellar basal-body rod protein FlgF [Nitrospina watsonii]|uniref:Flagellar basal-body rod protein flgG n=1 Tax=Nitrospina watsonii TaxID=1323948 RepID=A0ABN8W103_9BACT|nr:flagellar basal-body rod protein FlgF [Nitrospina watsonii]CAI2719692.1 Putative Flagellar basal-body rod protein flgG [Nitrospina watsonii]